MKGFYLAIGVVIGVGLAMLVYQLHSGTIFHDSSSVGVTLPPPQPQPKRPRTVLQRPRATLQQAPRADVQPDELAGVTGLQLYSGCHNYTAMVMLGELMSTMSASSNMAYRQNVALCLSTMRTAADSNPCIEDGYPGTPEALYDYMAQGFADYIEGGKRGGFDGSKHKAEMNQPATVVLDSYLREVFPCGKDWLRDAQRADAQARITRCKIAQQAMTDGDPNKCK
jgi:hypothetical protein